MRRTRPAVIAFIWTIIFLAAAETSPAYIIGPELILEKMVATMGRSSGYVVSQRVGLDYSACDAFDGHAAVFEETAWFKPLGKFRSQILVNDVKREYVSAYDRAVTIIDRQIISTAENPLMVYKELLVFRDRAKLVDRLSALGIDLSVVSLGRFDDAVAFVIGAKYPDESVSQLWVDKETFLPLRLLLKRVAGDSPVEVRYLDWRRQYRFRHPHRIEIYQNTRISRVICTQNIQNSFSESDAFFDVAALQLQYPKISAGRVSDDAKPDKQNKDIQQTIEDFKKLYQ